MLNVTNHLEKPLKLFLNATANETIINNVNSSSSSSKFNHILSINNKSSSIYLKAFNASAIDYTHVTQLNRTTNKLLVTSTFKNFNSDGFFNPILTLGNHAKEIILLSTAFVTMLLSTCFMFFIIWFCCYIGCKKRNLSLIDKRVKQSVQETEANLKEHGLNLKRQPKEQLILTTIPNRKSGPEEINSHEYDVLDSVERVIKKSKTTSRKKEKIKENLEPDENPRVVTQNVNEGYESDEKVNPNYSIRNRPRLTPSQIEKEFYEYTMECSKRLGDMLTTSDSQSSNTVRSSFDYLESSHVSPKRHPGVYSHNLKLTNKNRISHIKTAFNSDSKNISSKIKILKTKPKDTGDSQIWKI